MSVRPKRTRPRIHPSVWVFGYLVAGRALGVACTTNPVVRG